MHLVCGTYLLDLALQMQHPSWDRYNFGLNELILQVSPCVCSDICNNNTNDNVVDTETENNESDGDTLCNTELHFPHDWSWPEI